MTTRVRGPGLARSTAVILVMLAVASLAACEKSVRNMYDQPKYKPFAASSLWSDGRSARPLANGAVAHSAGTLAGTSSGRVGVTPPALLAGQSTPGVAAADVTDSTVAIVERDTWTLRVLERGHERYDIFCAPCHSEVGDGDGMIARRGFPHPPSFHSDRLREASDAHFAAVIGHGYGAMYSYADRVNPGDRNAIVAYIRALQLTQHATISDVPVDARAALRKSP